MSSQTAEFKTPLMSSAARRLPVGAEPQPGGGVHFRVWAPRPRTHLSGVGARRADAAICRWSARRDGYCSAFVADAGSRHPLLVPRGRRAAAGSRRRDISRTARSAPRRWSIRDAYRVGCAALARACRCAGRSSTRCTSARLRRKGPGAAPRRSCRCWRAPASRCSRSCPSPSFPDDSAGDTTASFRLRRRGCTARRTTSARSSTRRIGTASA